MCVNIGFFFKSKFSNYCGLSHLLWKISDVCPKYGLHHSKSWIPWIPEYADNFKFSKKTLSLGSQKLTNL